MQISVILIAMSMFTLGLFAGTQPDLHPEVIYVIVYTLAVIVCGFVMLRKRHHYNGKRQ